jgi:streptogramin lyase
MKKILLFIQLLSAACLLQAQTYSGPESVEFDYMYNRWFIANTQSHTVLSRDSNGVLSVFKSGLVNGPYGIEIVGDTLFCCSGASIKGYRLSDTMQVFNLNLGASFLNGITHDNNGNLIATDFTSKSIYKVNIAAQTFSVIASGLGQSPNGIIFDEYNNRCVFVNWGSNAPVKSLNLDSNTVSTIIPTTLSNCDGITRDNDGMYYISSWGNQSIVRYDSSFSSPYVVVVPSMNNPADIFYNKQSDTLGIPNSGNNTVVFHGFSTVSVHENLQSDYLSVYPNPFNDYLYLSFNDLFSEALITIRDLSGRVVYTESKKTKEGSVFVDTRLIPPGIYFLFISGESENKNCFKIIK